jgi:hypothetical protein
MNTSQTSNCIFHFSNYKNKNKNITNLLNSSKDNNNHNHNNNNNNTLNFSNSNTNSSIIFSNDECQLKELSIYLQNKT